MHPVNYCLGTQSAVRHGTTLRPTGIVHAVHDDEAFQRTSVCGVHVMVWPHLEWPPVIAATCDVCTDEVNWQK